MSLFKKLFEDDTPVKPEKKNVCIGAPGAEKA